MNIRTNLSALVVCVLAIVFSRPADAEFYLKVHVDFGQDIGQNLTHCLKLSQMALS